MSFRYLQLQIGDVNNVCLHGKILEESLDAMKNTYMGLHDFPRIGYLLLVD